MSKRKSSRDKKKNKKASNTSTVAQHQRVGQKLVTPFNKFGNLSPSSWQDDHAPEMLWAMLLTVSFPRDEYLGCFREIASTAKPWFTKADEDEGVKADKNSSPATTSPSDAFQQIDAVLDHTKLSELTDEQFAAIIKIPLRHPLGYAALRPLLLIESLPGIDRWKKALDVEPTKADWSTLAQAIISTLDHQSEQSTDVRWFKIILPMISGRIIFHTRVGDTAKKIFNFPNEGDMRQVRPSIRSLEMGMRRNPPSAWVTLFWKQLLDSTSCIDPTSSEELGNYTKTRISAKSVYVCRTAAITRFCAHMSATRTDPMLDGAFGFVFYAFALLEELASRSHFINTCA